MKKERLDVLEDNEKHLAKGVEGNYESDSEDGMSDDGNSEASDDEY